MIQELLSQIELLHKEMKDAILLAKVSKLMYDCLLYIDTSTTIEDLESRLKFLKEIHPLWVDLVYTYKLLPPDVWERYPIYGLKNTEEQRVLRSQRKSIRKVWKAYVKANAKNLNYEEADSGDSESKSVQSA